MSTAASARQAATSRISKLSHEEQIRSVEARLRDAQGLQSKMEQTLDKADTRQLGINADIANAKLSEVDGYQQQMNATIAELIVDLDAVTSGFKTQFDEMKQETTTEKVVGFIFGKEKSKSMRESRIRSADIEKNLTNLITKSDMAVSLLDNQLQILKREEVIVKDSATRVSQERIETVAKLADTTRQINELAPQIQAMQERIANEADQVVRTQLEAEFRVLGEQHNALVVQEQTLLSQSQALEQHERRYLNIVQSVQDQIGTQEVLKNKLILDTRERAVQYQTLVESLKTAAIQDNAHRINDIGTATDAAAMEMFAVTGAAAKRRMVNMLDAHKDVMQHAEKVAQQSAEAEAKFQEEFTKIFNRHQSGNYND